MDVLIRNAEEKDLDALSALEDECFSLPWTREQLRGELPDERHEFLVAEEDGAVVGYIGMMCVLDEGYISNVAAAPEARRRGIGTALIGALLRRAAERELSFVTLEVREHNEPAIRLYTAQGFEPVGLRKNYYDSPRENAVLMTCFIK
jgi:ribosomal-protein-alanine N-acetyltransferase